MGSQSPLMTKLAVDARRSFLDYQHAAGAPHERLAIWGRGGFCWWVDQGRGRIDQHIQTHNQTHMFTRRRHAVSDVQRQGFQGHAVPV